MPREILGEELLPYFYEALQDKCNGATQLLSWLENSWNPELDNHTWVMPDNHTCYVPNMVQQELRLKVTQLNYSPVAVVYQQMSQDKGISNIANVVHSIDAYVLRSLVRRCNYDKAQLERFVQLHESTPATVIVDNTLWLTERYNSTHIADLAMIATITPDNIQSVSNELRNALYELSKELLTYPPFEVVCVHDSFACSPVHMQRLRQQYNEVLVTLYQSNMLADILSQLYQDDITLDIGEKIHTETIRNSNYGIC